MTTPKTITDALRKGPVRCCVAYFASHPQGGSHSPFRGTTGTLRKDAFTEHLHFVADGITGVSFRFLWKDWQGLHIPSLQIFLP